MSGVRDNVPQLPVLVDAPPAGQLAPIHLDSPGRVRRETLRQVVRSKTFLIGAVVMQRLTAAGARVAYLKIAPEQPVLAARRAALPEPVEHHPPHIAWRPRSARLDWHNPIPVLRTPKPLLEASSLQYIGAPERNHHRAPPRALKCLIHQPETPRPAIRTLGKYPGGLVPTMAPAWREPCTSLPKKM